MGDTLVLGQVMATIPSEEENNVLLSSVVTADVGKFHINPQNEFHQSVLEFMCKVYQSSTYLTFSSQFVIVRL